MYNEHGPSCSRKRREPTGRQVNATPEAGGRLSASQLLGWKHSSLESLSRSMPLLTGASDRQKKKRKPPKMCFQSGVVTELV